MGGNYYMKKRIMALILILQIILPFSQSADTITAKEKSFAISTSGEVTGILTPEGQLYTFGNNEHGVIGNGFSGDYDGNTFDCFVRKPYLVMEEVEAVSIQNWAGYAIKKDHTLWSWGFNHRSALGYDFDKVYNWSIPTEIMEKVKFIATGHGLHMLAIKEDNTLWGWGQNDYGQVGNNKTKDVTAPVKVMSGVKYAAVGYEYRAPACGCTGSRQPGAGGSTAGHPAWRSPPAGLPA
jgi:alpha-tubulin suppressor-like RCC1 family protein